MSCLDRYVLIWVMMASVCFCDNTSNNYNKIFLNDLPFRSKILTVQKIVNTTVIQIPKYPSYQQMIESEPYKEINSLVSMNISYNSQDGFLSQWSEQRRNIELSKILTGQSKDIDEERLQRNRIKCELSAPSIKFNEMFSFHIEDNKQANQHNIITSYNELFEYDGVLDIWKDQSDVFSPIFILMSTGNLVVVFPSREMIENNQQIIENNQQIIENKISQGVRYERKSFALGDNLSQSAEFNSHRYKQEKKLFVFSKQLFVQINLNQSNNEIQVKEMKINFNENNSQIKQVLWIKDEQGQCNTLVVLTQQSLTLYSQDPMQKTYNPIPSNSTINNQSMFKFLNPNHQINSNQRPLNFTFQSLFYLQHQNLLLIIQKGLGMVLCSIQSSNNLTTLQITNISPKFINCQNLSLVPLLPQQNLAKYSFFMNCANHLRKVSFAIKDKKIKKTDLLDLRENLIPSGQIMLSVSRQGIQTIFIKGEAGVHGFKSWRYPKMLRDENRLIVDNFFVFGKEYISVIGNKVVIGEYKVEKQKLYCSYVRDESNLNDSESEDNKVGNNNKAVNVTKDQGDNQHNKSKIELYIEYIGECNVEILSSQLYNLKKDIYNQYEFCRYKKHYPFVQLMQSQLTNCLKADENILFIVLITIFILFVVGVVVWMVQKKKIRTILEEQDLPVGSQDLDNISYQNYDQNANDPNKLIN